MLSRKLPFEFDPKGVFHPLVMTYFTTLLGAKELLAHGELRQVQRIVDEQGATFAEAQDLARTEGVGWAFPFPPRVPYEILPQLVLETKGLPEMQLDADELGDIYAANKPRTEVLAPVAGGALVIVAYETCNALGYTDQGPLWEFLFHCRNAAAHSNRFHFHPKQPRFPAQWRKRQITASLQGKPLFGKNLTSRRAYLMPGDPLWLLWDIEQAHPKVKRRK